MSFLDKISLAPHYIPDSAPRDTAVKNIAQMIRDLRPGMRLSVELNPGGDPPYIVTITDAEGGPNDT